MMKKILAMLLAVLMLVSIVACGGSVDKDGNKGNNVTDTGETTDDYLADYLETYDPKETAESYVEDVEKTYDFGGHEFKFLNSAPVYSMYIYLAPDATGDVLDEACVLRNVLAQEKFNITITEETQPYTEIAEYAQTLIQSGENVYDAMYIGCMDLTPLVAENMFVDLLEVEELNIDEVWWDQPLIKRNTVADRLFYATSDLHLMAFEGVWGMYFSEGMMQELGLDFPYQLVTDGKWTMEKLNAYSKEAANLNGDQSFKYDINGNATYGEVSMAIENGRLYAFGVEYVARDENGRYQFTADTDPKFTQAWETLIDYHGSGDGRFVYGNNKDLAEDGYYQIFIDDRALFLSAELKGATMLREWEGTFGLIPQPKYSEAQESYESKVMGNVLSFCIPNTNTELSRTGIIVDYLTYESYTSLVPRYYDIHVGLKALTQDESRESLAIIRGSRGIEVSVPFDWTYDLSQALVELSKAHNLDIASTIETYREACISAINKTYEEYPTHGKKG
ncbi:MAG: hypothetical protein II297_03940 [Clostridia bacterium]|nr:hypothetical protein [Clostridia bacterium]